MRERSREAQLVFARGSFFPCEGNRLKKALAQKRDAESASFERGKIEQSSRLDHYNFLSFFFLRESLSLALSLFSHLSLSETRNTRMHSSTLPTMRSSSGISAASRRASSTSQQGFVLRRRRSALARNQKSFVGIVAVSALGQVRSICFARFDAFHRPGILEPKWGGTRARIGAARGGVRRTRVADGVWRAELKLIELVVGRRARLKFFTAPTLSDPRSSFPQS